MELLIIGAGGHARVVAEAAGLLGLRSIMVVKDSPIGPSQISEESILSGLEHREAMMICGVGSVGPLDVRRAVLQKFAPLLKRFTSVISPAATVSLDTTLGHGVFVAQGAQVCSGATLDDHVIVNTGGIVDHDCRIGTGTHIAPGAVLSGGVNCGEFVHVGTGAVIIQGISVCPNTMIGAGAVVTEDIREPGWMWIGVPAKKLARNRSGRE